jgi:hypothetical protein
MIHHNLQNNKKSKIIPIEKNKTEKYQYSLKHTFFDPAKSSPPNDFIKKLHIRLSNYGSSTKNIEILDNK